MLKVPKHQVAGHVATETDLGPLVDGAGLFYKPLQSSDRGPTELSFYSNPQIPAKILDRFFPKFHGTTLLKDSHPHLILDDLTSDFSAPSVVDFKIGSRTWSPSDPHPYFLKCIAKDRETTSLSLGFRISGLQIHDGDGAAYKPSKGEVKRFGVGDVRRILRSLGKKEGVMEGVLGELVELKAWFEEQTVWHFYSASLLVMYEEGKGKARVKMVDFAHVADGGGVIDHNFLGGICSLIKFVKEAIAESDEEKGNLEDEK